MWGKRNLLLVFLFDCLPIHGGGHRASEQDQQSSTLFRGLDPALLQLYSSRLTETKNAFRCIGANPPLIPLDAINDDFCDCQDCSDEPGTSAQLPHLPPSPQLFFCRNEGHQPRSIPRWKVNDGRCDCCDGSDEWETGFHRMTKPCPNTCAELEARWRAQTAKQEKEMRAGVKNAQQLLKEGEGVALSWEKEIANLNSEEKKIRKMIDRENKNKAKRESEEKKENEGGSPDDIGILPTQQATTAAPPTAADIAVAEEGAPEELDSSLDDGEEAREEGEEESGADKVVSEFAAWMEKVEDSRKEDGFVSRTLKSLGSSMRSLIAKLMSGVSFYFHKLNPLKKALRLKEGSMSVSQMEARMREIRDKKDDLKSKIIKSRNMGKQWLAFANRPCPKNKFDKYEYEVCFLGEAAQMDSTGTKVKIGSFDSVKQQAPLKYQVTFTDGARCWNGPRRSLIAEVSCGSSTKILSANEVERCVYRTEMTSPAACIEHQLPTPTPIQITTDSIDNLEPAKEEL